ncbi:MAG: hypothetical protein RJA52_50, partial [Bacteroidota bacterium]
IIHRKIKILKGNSGIKNYKIHFENKL